MTTRDDNSVKRDKIMSFVRKYWKSYKRSPSIREIGEAVNIASTSGVVWHLRVLEDQEEIELRTHNSVRSVIPKGMRVVFDENII